MVKLNTAHWIWWPLVVSVVRLQKVVTMSVSFSLVFFGLFCRAVGLCINTNGMTDWKILSECPSFVLHREFGPSATSASLGCYPQSFARPRPSDLHPPGLSAPFFSQSTPRPALPNKQAPPTHPSDPDPLKANCASALTVQLLQLFQILPRPDPTHPTPLPPT